VCSGDAVLRDGVFGISDGASEVRPVAVSERSSALFCIDRNHYVIRRRCVLPAWWICGSLTANLSAELTLVPAFADDCQVLLGQDVPPKFFFLVCSLWNEMLKLVSSGRGHEAHVEIALEKILKGTSVEISEQLSFLESYWASPIFLATPALGKTTGGRSRQRRPARAKAAVNWVRHSRIVYGDNLTLRIDFASSLEDFCLGRLPQDGVASTPVVGAGEVVSVNPDVLLAFGGGRSLKKLASYLLVEFLKRQPTMASLCDEGWFGGMLECQSLWGFHKELLGRTKALYDHGVFGWANSAPRVRVAELRRQRSSGAVTGSGLVHLFRVSEQTICAARVETELVRRLGGADEKSKVGGLTLVEPALPKASVQEVRELRTIRTAVRMQSLSKPLVVVPVQAELEVVAEPTPLVNTSEGSSPVSEPSPEPAIASESEHEFIVRVADYYASLSEEMRRLFEIERSQMLPEEFKIFISTMMRAKAKPRRR
jgi:hypothetical protein